MFHNRVLILYNIILQLQYLRNELQGVCVCVFGLSIPAFLKLFCSFIHVVLLLSVLPRVSFLIFPRSSSPPILSGELQIFGRHPICRCCVVIAFCWCKKKIKIDSLRRFAQYHFSLLAIWSAVVWKELINNTVVFLLFMFNFSCTFIDFLPFLCLVDPHFSLFNFFPIFCHSY